MAGTEILDADTATPAIVTTQTLVIAPADFARAQLQARRSAGMRAVAGIAADLQATADAMQAARGETPRRAIIVPIDAYLTIHSVTETEIDAAIANISEVF